MSRDRGGCSELHRGSSPTSTRTVASPSFRNGHLLRQQDPCARLRLLVLPREVHPEQPYSATRCCPGPPRAIPRRSPRRATRHARVARARTDQRLGRRPPSTLGIRVYPVGEQAAPEPLEVE